MRGRVAIAAACVLVAGAAWAGDAEGENAWAWSVSAWGYDVPDTQDYVNPNFTADRGMLHLEGRYNYEAIDSVSLWGGANFSVGEKWVFDATVMLGVVAGSVDGFAPGYRMSLERGWFSISSEGEYLFDTTDRSGDYFYCWNEVTGSPTSWFRLGFASQRTRAYETGLSIQRGLTVGFTYEAMDVAFYAFNLDQDRPTYVLAVSFDF